MSAIATILLALLPLYASAQVPAARPPCLLQKVTANGLVAESYQYNDKGHLLEIVIYEAGKIHQRRRVLRHTKDGRPLDMEGYDADGKLSSKLRVFTDTNELVTRREFFSIDASAKPRLTRRIHHENDSQKPCPLQELVHYDEEENLLFKTRIAYTDANCSCFCSVFLANGQQNRMEIWVRDDNPGVYQMMTPFPYLDQHNRIRYMSVNAGGEIGTDSYTAGDIEYNAEGYPVKMTLLYEGGREETFTYEYLCR